MNLQEMIDVNIGNFNITTEIHESTFEDLGKRKENDRKKIRNGGMN